MEIGLLIISTLSFVFLLYLLLKKQRTSGLSEELRELVKGEFYQNREELTKNLRETRLEITQNVGRLNELLAKKAKDDREELRINLKDFQDSFCKNPIISPIFCMIFKHLMYAKKFGKLL